MNVLYVDNMILVAVKPENVPTQADATGDPSFLAQAKEYVKEKYGKTGNVYLGLVHRLDRPAGGVMVFARNSKAAKRLSDQVRRHAFIKTYFAVVTADISKEGTLKDYLLKDRKSNTTSVVDKDTPGAKKAVLSYEVAAKKDGYTLLKINLETGRPHQIRVQLANIGAPLLGDKRYGGRPYGHMCLWAGALSIIHPVTKERMEFVAEIPAYFPVK
ncbi:MAG: RluA family pseudouridine synthase [Christensenellaceae bacterium]|jgi:23S rRNA pseudouridine1911/1915/1917 synthase